MYKEADMGYSRIFGSQFPELLAIQEKKDIDDSVVNTINTIQSYIKNGEIANAKALYDDNKGVLEPYNINAAFINLLQEEIYNIGLLAKSKQTNIIQTEMPTTQEDGYWYLDYE